MPPQGLSRENPLRPRSRGTVPAGAPRARAPGVPRGRAPEGARQRERAAAANRRQRMRTAPRGPGGVSERARPRSRLACVSLLPWCPARRVDFKSCGQWGAAARGNGPGAAFESRPEPPSQPSSARARRSPAPAQPQRTGTHRSRGTGTRTRCCCFGTATRHPSLHRHWDPPLPRHRDLLLLRYRHQPPPPPPPPPPVCCPGPRCPAGPPAQLRAGTP